MFVMISSPSIFPSCRANVYFMQLAQCMSFEVQYTLFNCQRCSSCLQIQYYTLQQSLKQEGVSFCRILFLFFNAFDLSLKSVSCTGLLCVTNQAANEKRNGLQIELLLKTEKQGMN